MNGVSFNTLTVTPVMNQVKSVPLKSNSNNMQTADINLTNSISTITGKSLISTNNNVSFGSVELGSMFSWAKSLIPKDYNSFYKELITGVKELKSAVDFHNLSKDQEYIKDTLEKLPKTKLGNEIKIEVEKLRIIVEEQIGKLKNETRKYVFDSCSSFTKIEDGTPVNLIFENYSKKYQDFYTNFPAAKSTNLREPMYRQWNYSISSYEGLLFDLKYPDGTKLSDKIDKKLNKKLTTSIEDEFKVGPESDYKGDHTSQETHSDRPGIFILQGYKYRNNWQEHKEAYELFTDFYNSLTGSEYRKQLDKILKESKVLGEVETEKKVVPKGLFD